MPGILHAGHAIASQSGFLAGADADHVPGLVVALCAPVAAWGFLRLARTGAARRFGPAARFVDGYDRASLVTRTTALLLLVTGFIHLGLVPGHAGVDPNLAKLFFLNGVAFCAVAAGCFIFRHWRPFAAVLLVLTIFAYVTQVGGHHEDGDSVGMFTKLVELIALGLTLIPDRVSAARPTSPWRWAGTVLGVLVMTVFTGGVTWGAGLAPAKDERTAPAALASEAHSIGGHNTSAHQMTGMTLQPVPDTPPTPEQRAAADRLAADTKAGIARFEDINVALAEGYRPSAGTQGTMIHYENKRYSHDGRILDPTRPETLVYANTKHGPVLLGAMYMMEKVGQVGPDIGGSLTPWHVHDNICFSLVPLMLSGFATPFGTCAAGSIHITTPAMIHVWTIPNPTGNYGDLDPAWLARLVRS